MKSEQAEYQCHIAAVKFWIRELVLGMHLCPFARYSFEHERILFRVDAQTKAEINTDEILDFIYDIDEEGAEYSNGFLIFPFFSDRFVEFQRFVRGVEAFLEEKELNTVFQIVGFHPDYQFADAGPDDISNYVNRSPSAMIHFLKVSEVAAAIESHPGIEKVADENILKMRQAQHRVLQIFRQAVAVMD